MRLPPRSGVCARARVVGERQALRIRPSCRAARAVWCMSCSRPNRSTEFVIVCTIGLAAAAAIGWAPGLAAPIEVAPPPPVPWLCLEPTAWMRAAPVVAFAFQFHQNSARPRAQRTHAPLQAGAEHS